MAQASSTNYTSSFKPQSVTTNNFMNKHGSGAGTNPMMGTVMSSAESNQGNGRYGATDGSGNAVMGHQTEIKAPMISKNQILVDASG